MLELICDGYTNTEIAEELGYGGTWAPQTVGRVSSNIALKLKARNRAHAVALAIRSGLIEAAA